jgi:energy-coupling factor transporter ATP-binding protein EcfA2
MSTNNLTPCDQVIGGTAFDIIERRVGSALEEERPFFRVKNLTDGEAVALIDTWITETPGKRLSTMTLVVATDSSAAFPAQFRADPERSITDYRNNNQTGLVYIETKVESDAQGLKSIFSLSDRNFLDGSFDDEGSRIPQRIVEKAWVVAGGNKNGLGVLVAERIVQVLDHVHPKPLSISVRMFTTFALATVTEHLEVGGNLDSTEVDQLVGRNLLEFGLFPDEDWRAGGTDRRIARTLELNSLRAELASSSNSDLDIDKMLEQVQNARFKDPDGTEYSDTIQNKWRDLCAIYLENPSRDIRAQIPYRIFEQLFAKDVKGLQLGDRIENELQQTGSDRVAEFNDLGIQSGLNKRQQEDASKLLDSQPSDDQLRPLSTLLSAQTLRMVERAARPNPERFTNPLIKIAEITQVLFARNERTSDDWQLCVKPAIGDSEDPPSAGLFAFLYGTTISSVMTDSKLDPSGIELVADPRLTQVKKPPRVIEEQNSEDEEDEESQGIVWAPLPIEFVLISSSTKKQIDIESGFEWIPEAPERTALLWLLLAADDVAEAGTKLRLPEEHGLDTWVNQVVSRNIPITSAASGTLSEKVSANPIIRRFHEITEDLRKEAKMSGLSSGLLQDSFDQWKETLIQAKNEFIPEGRIDERIAAILDMNCLALDGGGRVLMFASHPFRLRWLGAYLARSENLAIKALAGELPLNRKNSSFYLDWIATLSPHQQPAVTCNSAGHLILASGELGWGEEFAPLESAAAVVQESSVDPSAIAEISAQLTSYLEAHPYKKDGLSLLVVLTTGAKFPSELVKSIRSGDWRTTSVNVHILAPRQTWESVSNHFEAMPGENRMSSDRSLFPPIQISFHDLQSVDNIHETLDGISCDVAVIPKFLRDEVEIQENTEAPNQKDGRFEALVDRATHVYGGSQGGAISVSMRPKGSAPAIDAWSTLAVRQHRTRPVAPLQPENTDFAEIRINFAQTARLFEEVHKVAHWVVTLERYISREQIETLEPRPDILTIRDNVGISGLYTLIVSSHSGRKFIVDRLTRKLRRITKDTREQNTSAALAESIYDETRLIAPRLALQAMGVSRVTEEILGLKIARYLSELHRPSRPTDGVVAWISLDEHPEWFRGANSTRADLCRITLTNSAHGLVADFLVLEGKLRQGYDSHGEEQVAATLALIEDMLPRADYDPIDADLWRDRLASAIDDVAPEAKKFFGPSAKDPNARHLDLALVMRENFRAGRFKVGSLEGLFSICLYESEGTLEIVELADKRISVARSYRNEVLGLVAGKVLPDAGSESTGPSPAPAPNQPILSTKASETQGRGAEFTSLPTGEESPKHLITAPDVETSEADSSTEADTKENGSSPTKGRLSNAELERRYQVILDTYGQFDVPVHKPANAEDRFIEGPASILFRLRPGMGVDPKNIYAKADSLKLGLELDAQQAIRFSIHLGNVNIDVPKSEKDRYFVKAPEMWKRWARPEDALEVPIGEDHLGELVTIDFSSANSPHLLIGGTTGSGKSEALNTILEGLTKHYSDKELRLQLIDPKSTELLRFEDVPHLIGTIGYEAEEAINLLKNAVDEMQARYARFREAKTNSLPKFNQLSKPEDRLPWWVIVLDEYADLTSDGADKKEIEALLKRLAQKARAAGIHVIIATQKPSSEVISTSLRSNLPAQLALRVKSATESRVIMDESGAETLNGKGDAFFKANGELIRTQCGLVLE